MELSFKFVHFAGNYRNNLWKGKYCRLYGGGWSLMRTALRIEFPANREFNTSASETVQTIYAVSAAESNTLST
jgi:hypothetical protein